MFLKKNNKDSDESFLDSILISLNNSFELRTEKTKDEINHLINKLTEFLVGKPFSARGYYTIGLLFNFLGNFNDAVSDFLKVISIDSNFYDAYSKLGYAYEKIGNYKKALKFYFKAIKFKDYKNKSEVYNNIGEIYCNILKKYKKALKYHKKAIKIDPECSRCYFNAGITFFNQRNYKEAIKYFSIAIDKSIIDKDPKSYLFYFYRALSFEYLGNYKKSLKDFQKTIEIDPNFSEAYYEIGKLFCGFGQFSISIDFFTRAIKIDPNYIYAYVARINAYNEIGESEKAQKDKDIVKNLLLREFDPELTELLLEGKLITDQLNNYLR